MAAIRAKAAPFFTPAPIVRNLPRLAMRMRRFSLPSKYFAASFTFWNQRDVLPLIAQSSFRAHQSPIRGPQ
jgi:hypothetical protein